MSEAAAPSPHGLPPPILVEDAAALERLLRDLEGEEEIAFDTEADSFYRYQERVCLIQVSIPERDYLVDPLRDLDLRGLGEVLADPARTKVFHDGEYDVLILKRDYGFDFASLFDTRVAAAALGEKAPGLAAVVQDRFGIELDKSLQRSNWSARPLTRRQIDYARLDTRFLIRLMHEQRPELEKRGRMRIVEGECRRLESLEPVTREFDPDEFMRIKGARNLSPDQKQVLRELYVQRDGMARERDVPAFKVIANPLLLALAAASPRNGRELTRVEGLSPKVVGRLGPKLLTAIRRGLEKGPLKRVPRPRARDGSGQLDEVGQELHERLKNWRKSRAEADDIDASLVMNRLVLLRLAKVHPRKPADLGRIEGLQDWQRELYTDEILDAVRRFDRDLDAGKVTLRRRRPRR